ncbi:hypothetical protein BaRGS_00022364 [Batillaria attramentaria]|uniref:Endonuclease V n=1 Tax=Batillaria attramentaria TaxID=370345 RepID=A0ABD0KHH3_9CAEN
MDSCGACGILKTPFILWNSDRRYCRACSCNQDPEKAHRTPCGQAYCRNCGFLLDSSQVDTDDQDFCSACMFVKEVLQLPESFNKSCNCECCSNHYSSLQETEAFDSCGTQPVNVTLREECSSKNKQKSKKAKKKRVGLVEAQQDGHSEYVSVCKQGDADSQDMSWTGDWGMDNWTKDDWTAPADDWGKAVADWSADVRAEDQVEEEIRQRWEREQLDLKKKFLSEDAPDIKKMLRAIRNKDTNETFYIGGVDISFIKGNSVDACAALVIVSFPDLKVVYRRLEMVKLTAPYIPGFLAFREVDFLVQLYNTMLQTAPQYKPSVIFVDGNGQLHPREFGLACQLGVLLDVPCVGVAKTLMHVDGIEDGAVRSTDNAPNPIYVSVGHHISISSAVTLVQECCKYRIPEPTRHADMFSRQYLADGKRDPEEIIG